MAEDATPKHKHLKIEDKEHLQMKADCESLKKHMDEADSDVAFQGYRRAWRELSRAYDKGAIELRSRQDAESRKLSQERRRARVQKAQVK